MPTTLVRACLLVLVAALAATAGQPPEPKLKVIKLPEVRPGYTAFPDLKPSDPDDKDAPPLPMLPTVADNAPLLRKVQLEQVREGLAYLARVRDIIRVTGATPAVIAEYVDVIGRVYAVAAELEEQPAQRVPWYEARVREYKAAEQFVAVRVQNGTDPPQRLHFVRFQRLQAEADLLKLKTAVDRPATAPPAICLPAVVQAQRSVFTGRLRRR